MKYAPLGMHPDTFWKPIRLGWMENEQRNFGLMKISGVYVWSLKCNLQSFSEVPLEIVLNK